ncbi:spore germination protein, partial [Bacillus thuringiensis]|nr:spore germination protein [Bacillus thuringiensis]
VAAVLAEGKIALFVDGSPYAITLPTTLIDFFSTTEDYTMPWIIASFFRLLRLFAFMFSVLTTPLYVAILTYHYELIPKELL